VGGFEIIPTSWGALYNGILRIGPEYPEAVHNAGTVTDGRAVISSLNLV
jgi:hypothetical protein